MFDHCHDLFMGFVSKYQVISTIYSPGARGSTNLFEFPDPPPPPQQKKKKKKKGKYFA